MTKANDLASLLDANGDVVSSALDNVPAAPTPSLTSLGIPNHDDITVDGSGNVGIGTSPSQKLDVAGGGKLYLRRADNATGTEIYNGGNTVGTVIDELNNEPIAFKQGGNEKMRISGGNLIVGGTSSGANNATTLYSSGLIISRSSDTGVVIVADRDVALDGSIIDFRKQNSTVGSIGTEGGKLYIDSSGGTEGKLKNQGSVSYLWHSDYFTSVDDGGTDLGMSDLRFKDLYLSGSISDGTNSKTVADIVSGGGGLASQQVFTSSGTWTKPSGVSKVKVIVTGSGGGGGYYAAADDFGAGGGAGGTAIKIIDVSAVSTVSVTVGVGGNAGASGSFNGGGGNTSSFGAYCSATGGGGGRNGNAGDVYGGSGGNGIGGDINITGGDGSNGWDNFNVNNTYATALSHGGASYWGGGGRGSAFTNIPAESGKAYGSGGGASHSRQGGTAGTGKGGVVVIEEYA